MPGFKNYQLTSTAFRVEFTFRNLTIIFTQPYLKNSVLDGQDGHVKGSAAEVVNQNVSFPASLKK